MRAPLIALATLLLASAANAQPRVDVGRHFQIRLHNQSDGSRDPAVGQSKVYFSGTFRGTNGDVRIALSQGNRELVSFRCQARNDRRVTCDSPWFDADDLDARRNADVRIVHVDQASDAETVLYEATFPVLAYWNWVGDRRGRPHHVEQRALALDSALGVAFARQISYGEVVDANSRRDSSQVELAYWDLVGTEGQTARSLRCRVGEGEWQAIRLSGPSADGSPQELRNRVKGRNDVQEERLDYVEVRFTAAFPFTVRGESPRLSTPPEGANGRWTCEVRDAERRVVRTLRFDVENHELIPHAAQDDLNPDHGAAVIEVALGEVALQRLDPAEMRRGFFGRSWSRPELSPAEAARAVSWRATAPRR